VIRHITFFTLTLLLIEFLDEFVFGVREAVWPLIRDDLHLDYTQVGLLLGLPNLVSSIVEPFLGILGDVWRRRAIVLGGGVFFGLALLLVAVSGDFWLLLIAFAVLYPASGAFVSLSQATLMDTDPTRHEQNMARWTFAGSVGVVVGTLAASASAGLGWGWRWLFFALAGPCRCLALTIPTRPARRRRGLTRPGGRCSQRRPLAEARRSAALAHPSPVL
jgi:FSR family fosmidomycin resistance protein-like MFS transporter